MRYMLANGSTISGDSFVEVPQDVKYPATEDAPERIETQLFNVRVKDLTSEQLEDLNISVVQEDPEPDGRFYIYHEDPGNPGKWISQPRNLDDLKVAWVQELNATAGSILSQSDWRVIKSLETMQPANPQVLLFRQDVRNYVNQKQARLEACATLEEFIQEVTNIQWPQQEF